MILVEVRGSRKLLSARRAMRERKGNHALVDEVEMRQHGLRPSVVRSDAVRICVLGL